MDLFVGSKREIMIEIMRGEYIQRERGDQRKHEELQLEYFK